MTKLLGWVLELALAYLLAGIIARFVMEVLYISGVHSYLLVRLCSMLFEGPFVTLFGIW